MLPNIQLHLAPETLFRSGLLSHDRYV